MNGESPARSAAKSSGKKSKNPSSASATPSFGAAARGGREARDGENRGGNSKPRQRKRQNEEEEDEEEERARVSPDEENEEEEGREAGDLTGDGSNKQRQNDKPDFGPVFTFAAFVRALMWVFLQRKGNGDKKKETVDKKAARKKSEAERKVPTWPFLSFSFSFLSLFPVETLLWKNVWDTWRQKFALTQGRAGQFLKHFIFKPDVFAGETDTCMSPALKIRRNAEDGKLRIQRADRECHSEDRSQGRTYFGGACLERLQQVQLWMVKCYVKKLAGAAILQEIAVPPLYYSIDPRHLRKEAFPMHQLMTATAKFFTGEPRSNEEVAVLVPTARDGVFEEQTVTGITFSSLVHALLIDQRRLGEGVRVMNLDDPTPPRVFRALFDEGFWVPMSYFRLGKVIGGASMDSLLDLPLDLAGKEIGLPPFSGFGDDSKITVRVDTAGLGEVRITRYMEQPLIKMIVTYTPSKRIAEHKYHVTKSKFLLQYFQVRVNVPAGYDLSRQEYSRGTLITGESADTGATFEMTKIQPRMAAVPLSRNDGVANANAVTINGANGRNGPPLPPLPMPVARMGGGGSGDVAPPDWLNQVSAHVMRQLLAGQRQSGTGEESQGPMSLLAGCASWDPNAVSDAQPPGDD
jgi:hypothetical protein